MDPFAIPIAALVISMSTFIFVGISLHQKAGDRHVLMLQADYDRVMARLTVIEAELARCITARAELRDEHTALLIRLVSVETPRSKGGGE